MRSLPEGKMRVGRAASESSVVALADCRCASEAYTGVALRLSFGPASRRRLRFDPLASETVDAFPSSST
jgi:hypothetical protein